MMLAGGPEAALDLIKSSGYAEDDLQAQAILAKMKNRKGATDITFTGPAERSDMTVKNLLKISDSFIK